MAPADALEQYGITVTTTASGLEVSSASLALPWHGRAGRVPGTAVRFAERLWEVVNRQHIAGADRFELQLWPDGEAIRHAACLDAATVEGLTAEHSFSDKRQRQSTALHLLLPLVGLLPARLVNRLGHEHGMDVHRVVIASAVLELAFAALVPLQAVSLIFHDPLLPGRWGWIAVVAAVAGIDAIGRLVYLHATNQPIGSVFTAPLLLVLPREIAKAEAMPMPFVTAFEHATGMLDLGSPTLRADWHDGGVLEFRGKLYRFVALVSHAAPWVYRFEALPGAVAQDLPRLRLTPPQQPAPAALQTEKISILGDALKMTAFAFGPGPLQREWELAHHLPPLALTLASAGLESSAACPTSPAKGRAISPSRSSTSSSSARAPCA
ncbi:MAG: hypothetical protein ACHQHM_06125, partial [Thermoanaerobaculales bacterium]